MEVITGKITLQIIFSKYWEVFKKCHVNMEFWFARYGPDNWALKHFGLKKSDRIPTKQFALKSA